MLLAQAALALGRGWHLPGAGEPWMELCSMVTQRPQLPGWSGEREPSACLPRPGSSGWARTPFSCLRALLSAAAAALGVSPQPFHRGAERAPSRSISSPGEGAPHQPRWPLPRLTPNASQLPEAQNQHRCFRHNRTMSPDREQSLPRAKQKAKSNPHQAVRLRFPKEYN